MKTVYKSKVGLEIVIPLAVVLGGVLFLTTYKEPHWIEPAIILPIILFVVHMFITTYYIIDNDTLICKCGFFYNLKVDITTIKKISETFDISNGPETPATSFYRLEILYNKYDRVLISPKDKVGFIKEIISLNPNIAKGI